MKSITLLILFFTVSLVSFGQDISGQWLGTLTIGKAQLRIVFNISETNGRYTTTMDSPDQGAKDIPTTSTQFSNNQLIVKIDQLKASYTGKLNNNTQIEGTFTQAGQSFPLIIIKQENEADKITINRPQEPVRPFPYYEEHVTFQNESAKITLAGTLTLPKKEGQFPVVVLISGSGPQDRNEALLGHKPFLVLADHLTKNGIGVLRYDDRGTAESTGDFKTATSSDFATDAEAAITYLKTREEINKEQIGLIGHSEGGLIAPMVAARSKDVDFIVLLAGPGIPGDELLLMQQRLIAKAGGATEEELKLAYKNNKGALDIIVNSTSQKQLKKDLKKYVASIIEKYPEEEEIPEGMSEKKYIKAQVESLTTPWLTYFLKYNPKTSLSKVECPVLAVNGKKDLQVPAEANLRGIKSSIQKGGNTDVTVVAFDNLNHLFQNSETGSPDEYASIEETFSPLVLETISAWILKTIR